MKDRQNNDFFTKDLSKLGRDLSSTLIVDDTYLSFCLQPGNGILINKYLGSENDKSLLGLPKILANKLMTKL